MFKDKLDWSLEFAMRKLEINKRVLQLIAQRKIINEKYALTNKNLKKREYSKNDLEKLLEENYMLKFKQIQDTFPKQFIKLLLKHSDVSQTRMKLTALIFDTVFILTCDVISQAKQTQHKYEYGEDNLNY